jgi:iron(III) transport system substrate-binding protein
MRQSILRSLAVGAMCSLGLAACGGSPAAPKAAGPTSTVDTGVASRVTPPDAATIAAAEKEGSVLLYTNADEQLMKPVAAAFKAKYPRIELRSLALDDAQVFQRYATEKATGARTADVVMTSNAVGMLDFVNKGNVANYTDPNVPYLPKYAQLAPGVVAMSEDPVVAVFNSALLPKDKQPKDMTSLAALSASINGKVGTTDIGNAVQFGAMTSYIGKHGESGWQNIEKIGPNAAVESGTGNLMQKLAQGQYQASYFVSGTVRALITGDAAKVLNYTYLTDGTPLIPRAVAVTKGAGSPNAAKVFVNFLLSVEGQEAACKGGFTPYRPGVKCPFGLAAIQEAVGADNMLLGGYPADLAQQQPAIVSRWNKAFHR